MTDTSDLLKIGAFAKKANTNLRTLRYYEELHLLTPTERSEGGFRYYRPTDVHRVNLIRKLQELGLTLERIGELLDTREEGSTREERMARVSQALEEHDELIKARILDLEHQRSLLDSAREKLLNCATCEHKPTSENNYCEPCVRTGAILPEFLSALF